MVELGATISPYFKQCETDLNLRIFLESQNTFRIDVRVRGVRPQRINTGLTQKDVAALNQELQQAIENTFGNDDPISDNDLSYVLHIGLAAFHRIFPRGVARETILRALELISTKPAPVIDITSEHFFVPWEILSSAALSSTDITSFWGMRYILSRTLIQENMPGYMVAPTMKASRPCIGLITCNPEELAAVTNMEIPALLTLHAQEKIQLSQLRPLDANNRNQELAYLGRFLGEELHIAHFACHAHLQDPLAFSYLRISNNFNVTMTDFFAQEFETSYHPFIILNACNTGVIHPLHTANWATLFWKCGARGVLATEFQVPDTFAATFVGELYRYFLMGEPIGEALRLARHVCWKEQHKPCGLAYALYSPAEIQIQPSQ